jgi:uncharacterized membrane protein YedE/YeeE
MSGNGSTGFFGRFKADYNSVFVEEWPAYLGGIMVVLMILGLMVSGLFWGVFGGLKLWGDWINNFIGLGPILGIPEKLESPLMHRMSIMNIALVIGAFTAALLSRQFLLNRPPKLEYLWAALGGTFMGVGATLAGGCTTGGFFTPLLHASPAGWAMWIGLVVGALIGLKLLIWTLENISWGMTAPPAIKVPTGIVRYYPWLGLAVVVGVVLWAVEWYASPDNKLVARAIIVLAGFGIGFAMHRARLCFARAFREPFMTGEGHMTKAVIVALAIGIPLSALLFQNKIIDPYLAIPPTFWIGSALGGLVFGIGMIFAGGCASGALWRMGEGHIKLWVAVLFFAWSGSVASALLKKSGIMAVDVTLDGYEATQVGYQAYLPAMLDGWGWTLLISGGMLLLWYVLVRYNESTGKFTVS